MGRYGICRLGWFTLGVDGRRNGPPLSIHGQDRLQADSHRSRLDLDVDAVPDDAG
jgi:hypothetical protein